MEDRTAQASQQGEIIENHEDYQQKGNRDRRIDDRRIILRRQSDEQKDSRVG